MASDWISYNQLAWTEDFLADPAEYEQEVAHYADMVRQYADPPVNTLLHFGCGAGGHDRLFKRYFTVTGVDLSLGMLDKAREANPEIEYIEGDMRTIRLKHQFDAVVIPDSIDYMATTDDLRQAVHTAALHLRKGGVLLIVCSTAEQFRNNNFAYTSEKGDVHVTLFENNYINPYSPNTYEITLFYLIRQYGDLTTYSEHTVAGLFPYATWEAVFMQAGFTVYSQDLYGAYNQYLLDNGEYTQTIFIGRKQ
ncbi:MAG: class I SAM-dependent methyltransferase [Spirochaetia bacterium]